jgi:signal transduction histidine kinase
VDDSGRPVTLPSTPDRTVTLIGDGLAAVVHDPDLVDQLSLVTAAGSAARLALENERLHADQLAQIEELRRSRARITSAADQERRRIERDLHDGAQQRLVGAGLALQMAQSRVPDGEATELLVAAQAEVAMAVRELRELARGVYPAVLLDQGLAAALQTLADRSTVPVTVDFPSSRLPGQVEAAAYFIAAEAVTNIGKHAHATAATVTGDVTGDVLRLTIVDDGVGGACAGDGSGLQGLADRAGALGGSVTVTSPVGRGTTIEAVLPCASS